MRAWRLLVKDGKPEVLYIGAYCPFCAAERWAAIVALSRFGTFSVLRTVHSSSTDVDASTPAFTSTSPATPAGT